MANTVTINSADELRTYKATILSNLAKSVWDISAIIESENAQEVFRQFKFEKIATEPLSGKPENLVEVINQSQTYLVTLAATEYLLCLYPEKAFILNWGNVSGYDIESTDGTIVEFTKTTSELTGKFKYSEDGTKIRLDTKKSKDAFLKLMNDAFLRSELTEQYYEASAKDNTTRTSE